MRRQSDSCIQGDEWDGDGDGSGNGGCTTV
jgi:hypothetical protein